MEDDPREYSLLDILSSKHYPQVLRITRPFYVKGREYLKQGQYITLLDRRKVELITGTDQEGKQFKVRNDRSVQVEVIEEERIVYTLNVVVDAAEHIEAIEFGKEIRFEKQTFHEGERFKIEKIGKTFRGRTKNIALRRDKDNKVYRFPLDIIGHFKILSGNTVLPFSRILSLRTIPLTVRFRNTPTSSNFPPGTVKIESSTLCDVVYVLTVSSDAYTYEAFSVESNIFVEKCNLTIPKPIVEIIPNGMYVNSSEYVHPIKSHYKKKMKEIDTRLTEDIFSTGYYGSATFEKSSSEDRHLIAKERSLSVTHSLDENYNNKYPSSPTLSESTTPDSEHGERPAPFPRHNKKSKYRNTISFPAINESNDKPHVYRPADYYRKKEVEKVESTCSSEGNEVKHTESCLQVTRQLSGGQSFSSSKKSSISSNRSFTSNESTSSKLFYSPEDSPQNRIKNPHPPRSDVREVFSHYEPSSGPAVPYRHSRSSSIATEDSGDSGVALSFSTSSDLNNESIYATVNKNKNQQSGYVYQNIREVKVDINIDESSLKSIECRENDYDDVREILRDENQNLYENLASPTRRVVERLPSSIDRPMVRNDQYRYSLPPTFDPIKRNETKKRTEEILSMTQEQVSLLLNGLYLTRYVNIFNQELINGQLLRELTEDTLIKDLKMTLFEARKLFQYVHGWRPILNDINGNDLPIKTSNPIRWSVENLSSELRSINLNLLANFCTDHLIDGALLKNLIEDNIMPSLKLQHNISLSGIEMSRLKAFILKEWRPDNVPSSAVNSMNNNSINTFIRNDSLSEQRRPEKKNLTNDLSKTNESNRPNIQQDKKEKKYKPLWNKIIL